LIGSPGIRASVAVVDGFPAFARTRAPMRLRNNEVQLDDDEGRASRAET
jgi:hypothetical protein